MEKEFAIIEKVREELLANGIVANDIKLVPNTWQRCPTADKPASKNGSFHISQCGNERLEDLLLLQYQDWKNHSKAMSKIITRLGSKNISENGEENIYEVPKHKVSEAKKRSKRSFSKNFKNVTPYPQMQTMSIPI